MPLKRIPTVHLSEGDTFYSPDQVIADQPRNDIPPYRVRLEFRRGIFGCEVRLAHGPVTCQYVAKHPDDHVYLVYQ